MTTPTTYQGLTWDHPRGYNPLAAAACALGDGGSDINIDWHLQSLEGFETHPIDELAKQYDLVILDHPCMGEVVAHDCFIPIDALFTKQECDNWRKTTVGPSYNSYTYAGKQWALPLDAATQVCAVNPNLVSIDEEPSTWSDVIALADKYPICLSIAGPHALLTFFSICASITTEEERPIDNALFSKSISLQAYEILAFIFEKSIKNYIDSNPIVILDEMSLNNEIALCPLIYGYVNYASSEKPIKFINAPRYDISGEPSSTIGGTGIAISRKAQITPALLDHVRYLMSADYQLKTSPANHGQPSSEAAWRDGTVNAKAGSFYSNTIETMTNGWVRPRYQGYVDFQSEASATIRSALRLGKNGLLVTQKLRALYDTSRKITA